jgi:hypothetical protein
MVHVKPSDIYAEIVAFTVFDAAFLDTGAVLSLTDGSQVTVGNLTTSLSGDVVVIGLAAAENTCVKQMLQHLMPVTWCYSTITLLQVR